MPRVKPVLRQVTRKGCLCKHANADVRRGRPLQVLRTFLSERTPLHFLLDKLDFKKLKLQRLPN